MRFEVLGEVAVRTEHVSQPRLRPKERHVLGRLLVHPSSPVTAESLMTELWGSDARPAAHSNSLRVHLSHLRNALRDDPDGPSRLVTTSAGYVVAVQPFELDAGVLASGLVTAREQAATDPAGACATAVTALDLWRGEPFGDIDSPSLVQHRRYLEGVHFELAQLFADLDRRVGRTGGTARLRGLADLYPTAERIATSLAVSEFRDGDRVRALKTLRDFRARLVDEYGLDPSDGLVELERRLLSEVPEIDGSPGDPSPPVRAAGPVGCRPADLTAAVAMLAGGARLVIHGVRGIGKSSLVRGLARDQDLVVLVRDHGEVLGAVRDLVEQLAAVTARDTWAELRADAGQPNGPAVVADRIASLLAGRARLLLDDVDALDADSAEVLRRVMVDERCAGLDVVVTAPDLRSAFGLLSAGTPGVHVDDLEVAKLNHEEVAALVADAGVAPGPGPFDDLSQQVLEQSGGHPVLAAAIARQLARTGVVSPVASSATAWVARIRADLAHDVRRVLDLLVADGPDFDVRAVGAAARVDTGSLTSSLELLLSAGLIQYSDGHPRIASGFQEPLEGCLTEPERQRLSLAMVEVRRSRQPVAWRRLAHHVERCGGLLDPAEAARLLAAAGAADLEQGGPVAAVELLENATRRAPAAGVPDEEVLAWALDLVAAYFTLGDLTRGTELAVDVAHRAEAARVGGIQLRASVLAASPLIPHDSAPAARSLLERILRSGNAPSRPAALEALMRSSLLDPGPTGAQWASRLLEDEGGGTPLEWLARRHAGVIEGLPAATRLEFARRAADLLRAGDPRELLGALRVSASDAVEAGHHDTDGILADYEAAARRHRDAFSEWNATFVQGSLAAFSGASDRFAELDEREQALRRPIDPGVVEAALVARGFAELWAARDWDTLAEALRADADLPVVYRPVIAVAGILAGLRSSAASPISVEVLETAAGRLGRSSLQVSGWAFVLACLDHPGALDNPALRAACLRHLAPHRDGVLIIDGGWGIVAPVANFLGGASAPPPTTEGRA